MSGRLISYDEAFEDGEPAELTAKVATDGGDEVLHVVATRGDDGYELSRLYQRDQSSLHRETFALVWTGVEAMRDRGHDVDVGDLEPPAVHRQSWEADMPPTTTGDTVTVSLSDTYNGVADGMAVQENIDSDNVVDTLEEDGDLDDQDEQSDETDDTDTEQWCGICGAGPYEMLAIHHGQADDHEGDPIPLDHEPTDDELVGEGDENAVGQDGADTEAADEGSADDDLAVDVPPGLPENPDAFYDETRLAQTVGLDELLDAASSEASIYHVVREVDAPRGAVTRALEGLGLAEDGSLLPDETVAPRLDYLQAQRVIA